MSLPRRTGGLQAWIPSARLALPKPSVTFVEAGSDTGYTFGSYSPLWPGRINLNGAVSPPSEGFRVCSIVLQSAGRWMSGWDYLGYSPFPSVSGSIGTVWASWVSVIEYSPPSATVGVQQKLKIYGPTVGTIATYNPASIWCKYVGSPTAQPFYDPTTEALMTEDVFGAWLFNITPDSTTWACAPTESDTIDIGPTVEPVGIDATWGECSVVAFWPGLREADFPWG